jgi:hypothetical protein
VRLSQDFNICRTNLTDGTARRRYLLNERVERGLAWLGTLAGGRTRRRDDAESRKETI